MRCIYEAKRTNNNTVTLVCERDQECCEHGCCPKDQHWMAGVYVLLAFVLLVFVVGTCLMICCYQRSKNRQRKEELEAAEYRNAGYAPSQVGRQRPQKIGTDFRSAVAPTLRTEVPLTRSSARTTSSSDPFHLFMTALSDICI